MFVRGVNVTWWVGLMSLCALGACGPVSVEPHAPNAPTDWNVIFVTVDGVRWQELFDGSDPMLTSHPEPLFPQFWGAVAPRGVVYGDRHASASMTVATAANASLPGYTSMYAEVDQGCLTNYCARIAVPTFLDRLHDELGWKKEEAAVFASWWKMRNAVSGRDDVAVIRAGVGENLKAAEPEAAPLDEAFDFDRGTIEAGLQYLAAKHPRYLHLAFLDSDRYGHQGRYAKYVEVLGAYDVALRQLVDTLDRSGEWGRHTALVVTTDHGRGLWDQWADHGPQTPASADVWAFVMLPAAATNLALVAPTERPFTHHDVRYTIEALFGLGTRTRTGASTGFVRVGAVGP